jgi:hypothetical protein
MSEPRDAPAHDWEAGFDGHERAQRARLARVPLVERLQWLEDAHRVVRHLESQRSDRNAGGSPDAGPTREGRGAAS